jgi:hypothetical protein
MNIKQYILIASIGFLLFSCGEEVGNNDLDIGSPEEPTIDIVERSDKIKNIIYITQQSLSS